ncbi:MAG: AmmeMemoRadiSam system protein A [bacterium]
MRNIYTSYLPLFFILVFLLCCSKEDRGKEERVVEEKKSVIGDNSLLLNIDSSYDRELLEFSKKTLRSLKGKIGQFRLSVDNPYRYLSYGVFVTLRENGELRGCIGQIFPETTVETGVREMTYASAFNDPRFKPVTEDEIEKIKIEISILYNMHKIKSVDEFKLKRDGVLVKYGDNIGVLLPQVAEEGDWTRERFFEIASMKAGLGPDGWRRLPVEFYTFNCKIIREGG